MKWKIIENNIETEVIIDNGISNTLSFLIKLIYVLSISINLLLLFPKTILYIMEMLIRLILSVPAKAFFDVNLMECYKDYTYSSSFTRIVDSYVTVPFFSQYDIINCIYDYRARKVLKNGKDK